MKKILALLLAMMMLLLVGCNDGGKDDDSDDKDSLPASVERGAVSYFESRGLEVDNLKLEHKVRTDSGKTYLVSAEIVSVTDEYFEDYIGGYIVAELFSDEDDVVYGASTKEMFSESEKSEFESYIESAIEDLKKNK